KVRGGRSSVRHERVSVASKRSIIVSGLPDRYRIWYVCAMKLFRVAAAFGAGALAGWAAMAFIGAKPGVEGHAATGAASRFEAAQQRIDGLEASLARLTEQLSALDATGAWQAGAAAAMSSAED